jgi:hypothetical protein
MKNKIKTIILVVLLSCLVWILAERAVSQDAALRISIELTNNREDLLLQCLNGNKPLHNNMQSEVEPIEVELVVRGPGRLIQAAKGKQLPPLNIPLDMAKYAPAGQPSQTFTLLIVDLLNGRLPYENDYLQVIESSPPKIDVRITQLVKRTLPIRVYDQYKVKLAAEIEPAEEIAYVIDGQPAEARIDLTPEQQQQARQDAISVWGQIVLPDNLVWKFPKPVQVRLQESETVWPIRDIKTPRLGILISPRMAKKWQVEVDEDALKEYVPIRCRGAAQAAKEYVDSEYHLILEIKENDPKEETLYRPPLYNLPPGCEQPLSIVDPQQIPIPFKLVPLPGAAVESPK